MYENQVLLKFARQPSSPLNVMPYFTCLTFRCQFYDLHHHGDCVSERISFSDNNPAVLLFLLCPPKDRSTSIIIVSNSYVRACMDCISRKCLKDAGMVFKTLKKSYKEVYMYWFQYKKIEVILAYLQIVHHIAVG